jgi:hypothetical protein
MKGQSEQMGPLLSKLESPPFPSSERPTGGWPSQPKSRQLAEPQKLLILRLRFTSPVYLSKGRCFFDHTIFLPLPKRKSDLEVRLEEVAAEQVLARYEKSNRRLGKLAGLKEVRGKGSFNPVISRPSLGTLPPRHPAFR